MYGADVSASLVSRVTDAVIDQVVDWQSRSLDPLYPIVYLDCMVLKIRQEKRVINKSWRANWENLNTLFEYPSEIRKAIYTIHAIESLNSAIRKATKRRKVFPTDDSARKVSYLAIQEASKKWSMPIRDWKPALNRFMILFEDRVADFI